jgi:hypothetical protein
MQRIEGKQRAVIVACSGSRRIVGLKSSRRDCSNRTFTLPTSFSVAEDLPVQIAELNPVSVDNTERPNAGSGEMDAHSAPQASCTGNNHSRLSEALLLFFSEFFDRNLSKISFPVLVVDHGQRL